MFTRKIDGKYYLAIFNSDTAPKSYHSNLKDLGMLESTVKAKDLLSGSAFKTPGAFNIRLNGADEVIYQLSN